MAHPGVTLKIDLLNGPATRLDALDHAIAQRPDRKLPATRWSPPRQDTAETWGGADVVVLDAPPMPLRPEDDPWGRSARCTLVITPHAEALGWLLHELWAVYVDEDWPLGKYGFLDTLAGAALVYQDGCPGSESERGLLLAVMGAARSLAREIAGGLPSAP